LPPIADVVRYASSWNSCEVILMLTKRIATVIAAAGVIAVATPAAPARAASDQTTRTSPAKSPVVSVVGTDCPLWSCDSNHNRRMLRQR
jgi:hypothetical protein